MRAHGEATSEQDGGVSAEWIAAMVVVAALIAALLAMGLHRQVGAWGTYAACALFSTEECERPDATDPTDPTDPPAPALAPDRHVAMAELPQPPVCTMSTSVRERRFTTDWLLTRSIDGERFLISERSDGSVVIVDTEASGSGLTIGAGGTIPLPGNGRLGLSVSGSRVTLEETGVSFVLDADAFTEFQELHNTIIRDLDRNRGDLLEMELGFGGTDGLDTVGLYKRTIDRLVDGHATHDLHTVTEAFDLSLGAGYKIASGSMTISGSSGTTISVERDTGHHSMTFEMDMSAANAVGIGVFGVGGGRGIAGSGGGSVTLDYDASGELLSASVSFATTAEGDGWVGLAPGALPGMPTEVEGRIGYEMNEGGLLTASYTLPVRTDDDRQALADFLTDPVHHVDDLIDLAGRRGEVLVQGYRSETTSDMAEAAIRMVASAGISDERSHQQLQLVDAHSYDPVHGFQRRRDCVD